MQEWSQGFTKANDRAMHETSIELHRLTTSGAIARAVDEFEGQTIYIRGIDKREWDGGDFMADLGINVIEVADAGHYVMLDDPKAVYDAIFDTSAVPSQRGMK